MQTTDHETDDTPADRSSRSAISVAILAAAAFMPIVVAVGFLTDRSSAIVPVPGDISTAALRGMFDGGVGTRTGGSVRIAD